MQIENKLENERGKGVVVWVGKWRTDDRCASTERLLHITTTTTGILLYLV